MKVKQKSVCQTCRTRKLGCDGKRPGCSQCVLTGRVCDGYSTTWTFVSQQNSYQHSEKKPNKHLAKSRKPTSDQLIPVQRYSETHLHAHDGGIEHGKLEKAYSPLTLFHLMQNENDYMTLVTQNYIPGNELMDINTLSDYKQSRICGSWVEALPILRGQGDGDPVLPTAIKALAGSITSQGQEVNKCIVSCSQPYNVAIQALRKSFARMDRSSRTDLIAAAMCLTLVELMLPESLPALGAHIKGAGLLLLTYGPEACRSGTLHT